MKKQLLFTVVVSIAFSSDYMAMGVGFHPDRSSYYSTAPMGATPVSITDNAGATWYSRLPFTMPSGSEAYQAVASRMPSIPWTWRPSMPAFDRDAIFAVFSNNPRTSMISAMAIALAGGYVAWRLLSPAQKAVTTAIAATRVDQALAADTSNDAAIAAALADEEAAANADALTGGAAAIGDDEAIAQALGDSSIVQEHAGDAALAKAVAAEEGFIAAQEEADAALARQLADK